MRAGLQKPSVATKPGRSNTVTADTVRKPRGSFSRPDNDAVPSPAASPRPRASPASPLASPTGAQVASAPQTAAPAQTTAPAGATQPVPAVQIVPQPVISLQSPIVSPLVMDGEDALVDFLATSPLKNPSAAAVVEPSATSAPENDPLPLTIERVGSQTQQNQQNQKHSKSESADVTKDSPVGGNSTVPAVNSPASKDPVKDNKLDSKEDPREARARERREMKEARERRPRNSVVEEKKEDKVEEKKEETAKVPLFKKRGPIAHVAKSPTEKKEREKPAPRPIPPSRLPVPSQTVVKKPSLKSDSVPPALGRPRSSVSNASGIPASGLVSPSSVAPRSGIATKVKLQESDLDKMMKATSNLTTTTEGLNKTAENLQEQLSKALTDIQTLMQIYDRRFSLMEKAVDEMKEHVDSKFTELETKFTEMDTAKSALRDELREELDVRLGELQSTVEQDLESRVGETEQNQNTINLHIEEQIQEVQDQLEQLLPAVQDELKAQGSSLDAVKKRLEKNEIFTDEVSERTHDVQDQVDLINKDLDKLQSESRKRAVTVSAPPPVSTSPVANPTSPSSPMVYPGMGLSNSIGALPPQSPSFAMQPQVVMANSHPSGGFGIAMGAGTGAGAGVMGVSPRARQMSVGAAPMSPIISSFSSILQPAPQLLPSPFPQQQQQQQQQQKPGLKRTTSWGAFPTTPSFDINSMNHAPGGVSAVGPGGGPNHGSGTGGVALSSSATAATTATSTSTSADNKKKTVGDPFAVVDYGAVDRNNAPLLRNT